MKQQLTLLFSVLFICVQSQTNVSGGIFSNTTWTQANSPYIVTDTVTVFPGATLTINPGTTIKFNNGKRLVIRGGLNATGTALNPIVFTSNAASPSPGLWGGIYFNQSTQAVLNHCEVMYATEGVKPYIATIILRNSKFHHNLSGANAGFSSHTNIDSCEFRLNTQNGIGPSSNQGCYINMSNSVVSRNPIGINNIYYTTAINCRLDSNSTYAIDNENYDSLINCTIRYNGIGINDHSCDAFFKGNIIENNNIGINLVTYCSQYKCNKICNNTTWNVKVLNSHNQDMSGNFWCSVEFSDIGSHIYDGYDNGSLGIVLINPMDSVGCYMPTGINDGSEITQAFSIFPNPGEGIFTVQLDATTNAEVQVTDLNGRIVFKEKITITQSLNCSFLENGIYTVSLRSGTFTANRKLVVVH